MAALFNTHLSDKHFSSMWNAVLCPRYKSSWMLLSLLSNQLIYCLLARYVCLSKPLIDMENFKGDPTYVYRAKASPAMAGCSNDTE